MVIARRWRCSGEGLLPSFEDCDSDSTSDPGTKPMGVRLDGSADRFPGALPEHFDRRLTFNTDSRGSRKDPHEMDAMGNRARMEYRAKYTAEKNHAILMKIYAQVQAARA